MENSTEKYYIVGLRPVKLVKNEKGQLGAYAFDWTTGELELALQYIGDVFYRHSDDARLVSKEEFEAEVQELREELRKKKQAL